MTSVTISDKDADQRALLDSVLEKIESSPKAGTFPGTTSLAAMLGEYEPMKGHPGFYARAPKLRQQIEITRLAEQSDGETATATANLETAIAMARMAVFCQGADGEMRQATMDELLDTFTADEVTGIVRDYLGIGGGDEDPNA